MARIVITRAEIPPESPATPWAVVTVEEPGRHDGLDAVECPLDGNPICGSDDVLTDREVEALREAGHEVEILERGGD